jgi:hypothetical protein
MVVLRNRKLSAKIMRKRSLLSEKPTYIHLLQLGFQLVAVVGKLVQKYETAKNKQRSISAS